MRRFRFIWPRQGIEAYRPSAGPSHTSSFINLSRSLPLPPSAERSAEVRHAMTFYRGKPAWVVSVSDDAPSGLSRMCFHCQVPSHS